MGCYTVLYYKLYLQRNFNKHNFSLLVNMKFISVKNNPKIYFWAKFFGSFSFIAPVIVLFMLHRGLGFSDLLIRIMFIVVAMFIFEVPTGMFADRFGPKSSFIVGQVVFSITMILWIFAFTPQMFYLAAILTGLGITFFSGSDESFIYESLKEVRKQKQMSKIWARITSATFIPAIIGIIIGAILGKDLIESQFVLLILLTFGSSIINLTLLFFLKNPKTHIKSKDIHMFEHLDRGYRTIKSTPALLFAFFHEILIFIPTYIFKEYSQPLFVDAGIPVPMIGLIIAIGMFISFFLMRNLTIITNKLGNLKAIYLSDIFILIGFVGAMLWADNLIIVLFAFYSIKLFGLIRLPIFSQIKNDYIPSGSRATTLSLLSMIDSMFDVIILISLSKIANMGLSYIFLGCVIVVILGFISPIKLFKKRK